MLSIIMIRRPEIWRKLNLAVRLHVGDRQTAKLNSPSNFPAIRSVRPYFKSAGWMRRALYSSLITNESTEVQTLGVIRIQLIYSINVLSKYSSLIRRADL